MPRREIQGQYLDVFLEEGVKSIDNSGSNRKTRRKRTQGKSILYSVIIPSLLFSLLVVMLLVLTVVILSISGVEFGV